jgi:hypothetical protein
MAREQKYVWEDVNSLNLKEFVVWQQKHNDVKNLIAQYQVFSVSVTHAWYFAVMCCVLLWICAYTYKYLYSKYFYKKRYKEVESEEFRVSKSETRYLLFCTSSSRDQFVLLGYIIGLVIFVVIRTHANIKDIIPENVRQHLNTFALLLISCCSIMITVYLICYIKSLSMAVDKIKKHFTTLDKFFLTFIETNVIYGVIVITFSMLVDSILVCLAEYNNTFNIQKSIFMYGAVSTILSIILFTIDMVYLQISAFIILPYIIQILILVGICSTYSSVFEGFELEMFYGCFTLMIIMLMIIRFSSGIYKNVNAQEKNVDE